MNNRFSNIGRCISIFDHPGASPQEMVELIRVDKATLTKIIKKLSQIDFAALFSTHYNNDC